MNLYPGRCGCGAAVAAHAGLYRNGAVLCAPCAGRDDRAPRRRVAIRARENAATPVAVAPLDYLGDSFRSYRGVCDAAAFSYFPTAQAAVGRLEAVPGLLAGLRAAGFEPVVDPAIAASLLALADAARAEVAAADDRLTALEDAIADRGLVLFRFQRHGVRWLAERRTALLADEMGCGKTVQALLALPERAAVVVVGPASVREKWADEAGRWRPDLIARPLYGREALGAWPAAGRLVSLAYDGLPETPNDEAAPVLGEPAHAGVTLIYDEAHRLKGRDTARSRRGRALARDVLAAGGRVWLLTGSPLKNKADELWRVLEVAGLGSEAFGRRARFVQLADDPERYGELIRGVMLRRLKVDVLADLPPVLVEERRVEIDESARRELDALAEEMAAVAARAKGDEAAADAREAGEDEAGVEEAREAAEAVARHDVEVAIAMVLEGAVKIPFELLSRVKVCLAAAKLPAAREVIEDMEPTADDPVVALSAHLPVVRELASRDGWARLDGEDAGPEHAATVARFQAGELAGLAVSIRAGGEGIDLTRASRAILVDREWSPADNDQAIARLDRIGQGGGGRGCVTVIALVADHVLDRRISELLAQKRREAARHVETGVTREQSEDLRAAALAAAAASAAALVGDTRSAGKPRRGPRDDRERWAAAALTTLAGDDQDHARELNEMGFNRFDGEFGHKLARGAENGGLTDGQWAAALRMLIKYRRQVGEAPTAPGEDLFEEALRS